MFYGTIVSDNFLEETKLKLFDNIAGFNAIAGAVLSVSEYKKPIDEAKAAGDFDRERELIVKAANQWGDRVVDYFKADINVIHPENLPDHGPVVYICNHQSYADVLTFFHVIRKHQVSFIAKDALGKIPVFGDWILRTRGICIHRGDARASLQTINEGVGYLKQGFSLVIFPEGTRSRSSEIGEFKAGSFKLATKARVPIVPVTIDGGYKTFEETGAMTKGVHIDFMVHPAIETAGLSRQELAGLHEKVEDIVRSGLEEILAGKYSRTE